jgi:hypothetical protein
MKHIYAITRADPSGEDIIFVGALEDKAILEAKKMSSTCSWKGFLTYRVRRIPIDERIMIHECDEIWCSKTS